MVLCWHFLRHGLLPRSDAGRGDWGALDLSAIYQFALIALVGMLSQELFASLRARGVPTFLAGAGMVIGALAAALWGKATPVQPPMTLLAFSGVGLWAAILYSGGYRPPKAAGPGPPPPHAMHRAAVASCVVLCGALWFLFPAQGVLAAALLGGAAWLGAICLGGTRLRAAAIALAALALAAACLVAGMERVTHSISRLGETLGGGAALGIGEEAYAGPWESNLGPRLVALQIGWGGLAWLGAGLLAAGVLALRRAKAAGEGAATVLRLWSAGLAMAALFSSSGLFVPAVSLAVGFTWGYLQAPGARPGHPWSGWVFLALLTALMFLLALAPAVGLLEWACDAYGMRDDFLHVVCGMLFTAVLAWQLGSRKIWKGLVGVGLAVAAGGAGELAQYFLTATRNAEWGDFLLRGLRRGRPSLSPVHRRPPVRGADRPGDILSRLPSVTVAHLGTRRRRNWSR
jgi:hypothetical protein